MAEESDFVAESGNHSRPNLFFPHRIVGGRESPRADHRKTGGNTMETFLGEIKLVGFNFAPVGFLPCDGRLMQINTNTALFSLLGTTYGGDGIHTFALPTLPLANEPKIHGLYIIATQGIYPSRG